MALKAVCCWNYKIRSNSVGEESKLLRASWRKMQTRTRVLYSLLLFPARELENIMRELRELELMNLRMQELRSDIKL